MTWTETPAEAFRKKLIADAKKSEEISKKIIADCQRRQKEHDEWLIKKRNGGKSMSYEMILCETCLDSRKLLREATHEARGYECCVDCFEEMGV